MAEKDYFKRKINEGTIKRSHICSFDNSIKLEMLVVSGKKTMDFIIELKTKAEEKTDSKKTDTINEIKSNMAGLKINGLPVIYEDLIESFDSEEIMEVLHFINGGDMSIYGGEESPKNV
jgi:hypothetical protein